MQLTTPPLAVGLVRWSPDGRQLAFVGKPPDSLPRIYVMPSDGVAPEPLSPPEEGQVWDPCWMPDGKTVIWGRIDGGGIRTFDLETRKLSILPETDDLWFPKCSRQGLLLATRSFGSTIGTFTTYHPQSGHRTDLGLPAILGYPNFTPDGQSVIGYFFKGGRVVSVTATPGIYGFSLNERRLEKVADLGSIGLTSPLYTPYWVTLDPEDAPIVLSDTSTHEIYALDWEQP